MKGYSVIEAKVVDAFKAAFQAEMGDRVSAGDIDRVMTDMLTGEYTYGCLFEFGGGAARSREPFRTPVWTWVIDGMIMIRYTDSATIEQQLRQVIDKLPGMFDDHTLGNTTPMVELVRIASAETVTVNDVPFYWLNFTIEALDK
jgi:hypothetical protein